MWETITPETVSEYVRFDRTSEQWRYTAGGGDMYCKQAEGTAFLWNKLAHNDIALLADEVGMGKTLQALSVLVLLFHRKPNARVLIIAPRQVVADNWVSEYHTFIAQHYKKEQHPENVVCTEIGSEPIHPPHHCKNLAELQEMYGKQWPHLFIVRTSAFSYLLTGEKPSNPQQYAFDQAKAIREDLYNKKEKIEPEQDHPFDLLIVDEAHYYRAKHGGSQKVSAAQAFFGAPKLNQEDIPEKEWRPIASKTLLLTATPNHSTEKDIETIFSYFPHNIILPKQEEGSTNPSEAILQAVGLRRFRRFEERTKYQYRRELELPSSFSEPPDPSSEIFFAAYQKRLAQSASYAKKRFLHGYLEGFEALPGLKKNKEDSNAQQDQGDKDETETDSGKIGTAVDYQRSETDAELLDELVGIYHQHYGSAAVSPRHPKYDRLVKDVVDATMEPKDSIEKAVIFVRRIPSTKEIARRLNREYDKRLSNLLASAYGGEYQENDGLEAVLRKTNDQARLHPLAGQPEEDIEEQEEKDTEEETLAEYQQSAVINMFRSREKAGEDSRATTHEALFEQIQSFRQKCINRNSIISLAFHPGADYSKTPYNAGHIDLIRKEGRIDYEGSAFFQRSRYLAKIDKTTALPLLKNLWRIKCEQTYKPEKAPQPQIDTLWTIFWKHIGLEGENSTLEDEYEQFSFIQRESLSRFLRQGLLNASDLSVDLFRLYVNAASKFEGRSLQRNQQEFYRQYLALIDEWMGKPGNRLYTIMKNSVMLFRVIQTKQLAIHNDEELLEKARWRWTVFNNQSPAYGYHGGTKNDNVLHAFNSPFFPNILVSTSILQEGVNLHLFCNRVYHYGLACSAGDNEQRVGRVDRFFGKAHRDIKEGIVEGQVLSIYPYLQRTLDETQLADFVRKKYRAERLIDECKLDDTSPYIQNDENKRWAEKFLLRPNEMKDTISSVPNLDPYPAIHDKIKGRAEWPRDKYLGAIKNQNSQVSIKSLYQQFKSYAEQLVNYNKGSLFLPDSFNEWTIAVIEAKVNTSAEKFIEKTEINENGLNTRIQPVFFWLRFRPEVSGIHHGTIYLLSLVSPIADKKTYDKWNRQLFYQESKSLQENYPGIQICLDKKATEQSCFYLYARIDFPIFLEEQNVGMLSFDEIKQAFDALVYYTDLLELSVSGDSGGQDLQMEGGLLTRKEGPKFQIAASDLKNMSEFWKTGAEEIGPKWTKVTGRGIEYYQLQKHIRSRKLSADEVFRKNNEYPFVAFDSSKIGTKLRIAYPAVDFQKKESELLEKWAEYVAGEEKRE